MMDVVVPRTERGTSVVEQTCDRASDIHVSSVAVKYEWIPELCEGPASAQRHLFLVASH